MPLTSPQLSLSSLSVSDGYTGAILATPGLASYWQLESASCLDIEGGVNGTPTTPNSVVLGVGGGIRSSCASFGNSGGIDCGDVYDFAPDLPFSVELWANATADGTFRRAISTEYSTNRGWMVVFVNTTGWTLNRYDDTGGSSFAKSDLSVLKPGQWQHVVGTYDSGTITLYIDGVVPPNGINTTHRLLTASATGKFRIGCQGSSTGSAFNGLLDEVAIYSRALSATEVRYHYELGIGL